jgi:hypothetical protein
VVSGHSKTMVANMPVHRCSRETLIVVAAAGLLILSWMYFAFVPNERKLGETAIPYAQKFLDMVSLQTHPNTGSLSSDQTCWLKPVHLRATHNQDEVLRRGSTVLDSRQ